VLPEHRAALEQAVARRQAELAQAPQAAPQEESPWDYFTRRALELGYQHVNHAVASLRVHAQIEAKRTPDLTQDTVEGWVAAMEAIQRAKTAD